MMKMPDMPMPARKMAAKGLLVPASLGDLAITSVAVTYGCPGEPVEPEAEGHEDEGKSEGESEGNSPEARSLTYEMDDKERAEVKADAKAQGMKHGKMGMVMPSDQDEPIGKANAYKYGQKHKPRM